MSSGPCENYLYEFVYFDTGSLAIVIAIYFVQNMMELVVRIYLRRRIQPAFQIISPRIISFLKEGRPHQREIFLFFCSLVYKTALFFDVLLFAYIRLIGKDKESAMNPQLYVLLNIYATIFTFKWIEIVINPLYNLYRFLRSSPEVHCVLLV